MPLDRTRIVQGICGTALLASLASARAVASANERAVFVYGRELRGGCLVRHLFGVACPSCGMTRSVLLTLGGNVHGALALNPGGPLFVLGVFLLGAALLFFMLRPSSRFGLPLEGAWRRLGFWGSVYGGVVLSVMLVHWVSLIA
ncbi:MAG: DUF2752 domain-containing protein [Acidobacteria bacterium]|nr:DUF2752 domain-containing protein [Acidobacteriota bacterium]